MSIIAIIGVIWLASVINKAVKRQRAKQAAIEKQMAKQREAQRKINERLAKEQERQEKAQAASWERQRKEDARRDAQFAKHDEEIRKLKQTANRLSAKLEDLELRIIDLESVKELAYKQFLAADHAGDDARKEKALRKLISIDNQLSAARDARQKTLDSIENANKKIAA